MIIYSFNDQLSDDLVEQLSRTIKVDMYQHPPVDGGFPFYSSYNVARVRHFPDTLEKYYDDKFIKILYHLDLLGRTIVDAFKWCQIYNKSTGGKGHPVHTHFSGNQLLSMVHFIRTPNNQKCFYFIVEGQKYYPDKQNSGDFIVFPSWASHGVDPVECDDNDRIIVSANFNCNEYKESMDPDNTFTLVCTKETMWNKQFRKNMLTKVWSGKP